MMSFAARTQSAANIIATSLRAATQSSSVVIGGADLSDLPSKQAIIDTKIEEAMNRLLKVI